jgi:hypothetical protein
MSGRNVKQVLFEYWKRREEGKGRGWKGVLWLKYFIHV